MRRGIKRSGALPLERSLLSNNFSKGDYGMYIRNGIAYAGEEAPMLKVNGVRPLEGHRLWLRFNTGEARVFDFTPLLSEPAFAPLADMNVFRSVYIDYGIPVWNDGDIDIAPETLYEQSLPAGGVVGA